MEISDLNDFSGFRAKIFSPKEANNVFTLFTVRGVVMISIVVWNVKLALGTVQDGVLRWRQCKREKITNIIVFYILRVSMVSISNLFASFSLCFAEIIRFQYIGVCMCVLYSVCLQLLCSKLTSFHKAAMSSSLWIVLFGRFVYFLVFIAFTRFRSNF